MASRSLTFGATVTMKAHTTLSLCSFSSLLRTRYQFIQPCISYSSTGQVSSSGLLIPGKKFNTLHKFCMSMLSPAHQMKWSRPFRCLLQKLSVTQNHILYYPSLLLTRNQYLLSRSCNFVTITTKSHFSQLAYREHRANAAGSYLSMNNLVIKDFMVLNQVPSYLYVTHCRGLRGYPSYRTDKQNPLRKDTEVAEAGKQNINTDLSTNSPATETNSVETEPPKLSLYQRFKKTYKEHGKVLIAVHLLTSAVWFGSFYTLASLGFDIVPYLESWNFSEKVISPFRSGGLGDLALAYLFYKLATPARYTVTIAGTNLAIRYLRKEGKLPQVPQEDSIRSLYRESKEVIKKRSNARIKKLRKKNKNKQNGQ